MRWLEHAITIPTMTLLLAVGVVSAQTDLTFDAVTRGTVLNEHVGDVDVLVDGITPASDSTAAAVTWGGVGMLVVEWETPVRLARVRLFIGLMERYNLYGYLGGTFTDTGQRVGVVEPVYSRGGLAPLDLDVWFEILGRPDIAIDNLALSMTGTTVLYEIRFLGEDGTVIEPASLGQVKIRTRSAPVR